MQKIDAEFNQKYEKAIEGMSEEQLVQIAALSKSRLFEWVNSPAKIRPHLLKRWKDEGSLQYEDNILAAIVSDTRRTAAATRRHIVASLNEFAQNSKPRIEELKRHRQRCRENSPKPPTLWESLKAVLTFDFFGEETKRNGSSLWITQPESRLQDSARSYYPLNRGQQYV